MPSKAEQPSWNTYLTLDLIIHCARRTVLQPFFAWMLPLSLRAITIPYSHISFQLTVAYATFLTFFWFLASWNRKLAFGSSREVDVSEEIVVITGGARGLGKVIADFYCMKGSTVAVLDVEVNERDKDEVEGGEDEDKDEGNGIQYYQCDVGNAKEVQAVYKRLTEELGIPTILINNAAVVNYKSILDLREDEVERNFKVNTLSHFHTARTFIPGMLEQGHGTIVTVSSVLGYLGCANLSGYTASKAALLAFHASLRAELAQSSHPSAKNIKTVLVAPGQLGTRLFKDIKTPSNFLAPIVEPVYLAKEIVNLIDSGESGEIRMPFYAQCAPIFAALPVGLQAILRSWSGIDNSMIHSIKD